MTSHLTEQAEGLDDRQRHGFPPVDEQHELIMIALAQPVHGRLRWARIRIMSVQDQDTSYSQAQAACHHIVEVARSSLLGDVECPVVAARGRRTLRERHGRQNQGIEGIADPSGELLGDEQVGSQGAMRAMVFDAAERQNRKAFGAERCKTTSGVIGEKTRRHMYLLFDQQHLNRATECDDRPAMLLARAYSAPRRSSISRTDTSLAVRRSVGAGGRLCKVDLVELACVPVGLHYSSSCPEVVESLKSMRRESSWNRGSSRLAAVASLALR